VPLWLKDPDAILDYSLDWSAWLGEDTIVASTWLLPADLTKVSETFTSTQATIWLSKGTPGTRRTITNRITTAAGRTEDRTRYLYIKDR